MPKIGERLGCEESAEVPRRNFAAARSWCLLSRRAAFLSADFEGFRGSVLDEINGELTTRWRHRGGCISLDRGRLNDLEFLLGFGLFDVEGSERCA